MGAPPTSELGSLTANHDWSHVDVATSIALEPRRCACHAPATSPPSSGRAAMQMIRRFSVGLSCLATCGVAYSPAQAAPTNFVVSGFVAKACSLSATNVGITIVNKNNVITTTFSPTSVTAWCNTAGSLSVSSTRLLQTRSTKKFLDYKLSVVGWGAAMTYTTAASLPPATLESNATLSTTLSFSCNTGCTAPAVKRNKTYTATITLALSPN